MRLPAALITLPLLIGVVAGLMAADNGVVVAPASAAAAGLAWLAAVGAFSLAEPALMVFAAALGCTLAGASRAESAAQEV